jgi:hypothetical protein
MPQTTDEILGNLGIRTMEERFGDPYVQGSTYYKTVGKDGKVSYTNVPSTVAGNLGGTEIPEQLTGLGTTMKGPGGTAEVVMQGRALPGANATRAEIEALPARDQIRWYERMLGARGGQNKDIQDRLSAFNLEEATLPWDQRVTRMAQKQAALYNYLSKMPEFQKRKREKVDQLVEAWKQEKPVESKDPVALRRFVREAERLAEEKHHEELQKRMMLIMLSASPVAGAYARSPMFGLGGLTGETP